MNKKYVPKSLSKKDKEKQVKSIKNKTIRPKLKSFKSKRSSHTIAFEKKYGVKITNVKWIAKNLLRKKGIDLVLSKGRGAYYSSGSRPNQTPSSWAYARLASVLLKRKAYKIDKSIVDKYKVVKKS